MCFLLWPRKTAEGPLWRHSLGAHQTTRGEGLERQTRTFEDKSLQLSASVVLFSSNLLIENLHLPFFPCVPDRQLMNTNAAPGGAHIKGHSWLSWADTLFKIVGSRGNNEMLQRLCGRLWSSYNKNVVTWPTAPPALISVCEASGGQSPGRERKIE